MHHEPADGQAQRHRGERGEQPEDEELALDDQANHGGAHTQGLPQPVVALTLRDREVTGEGQNSHGSEDDPNNDDA